MDTINIDTYTHRGVVITRVICNGTSRTSFIIDGRREEFRLGAHAWNHIHRALADGSSVINGELIHD